MRIDSETSPAAAESGCLSWRNSPWAQLLTVSACNFATIGLWNALNGIGGLGTGDENLAHYSNSSMYMTATISGLFGGAIVNVIGVRLTLFIGSILGTFSLLNYFLYAYIKLYPIVVSVAITVALSCFTPAFLTSIGSVVVNVPTAKQRSLFIAINSLVLNLGGLFGAILALSMNANNRSGTSAARLDKSSYIALIGVAASGIGFSLLAQDPAKLTKSDGTPVVMPQMDFKKELRMLLQGLKDVNIWQMAPLFMSCMWHEVVLFNFMNAGLYNVRSRTANAGVYYIGRIVASFTFQYACDYHHRTRKRVATAVTFVAAHLIIGFILTLMVFCGFQRIKDSHDLDLTDKRAAIGWFIFFIFGSLETMASSMSYWLIGTLPFGDATQVNRLVGWFRMFSGVGGALSWALDIRTPKTHIPAVFQWATNMVLWSLALILVLHLSRRVISESKRGGSLILPTTESLKTLEDETVTESPHSLMIRDIKIAHHEPTT